jgi:hypothetical protein
MTAAIASIVLPPAPLLVAAVLGLLLLALLVLVAARRRARAVEVPADQDPTDVGVPEGDTGLLALGVADDDLEPSTDDPRALRLLVRTLEAAIEELSADLQRVEDDDAADAAPTAPAVDPVVDPVVDPAVDPAEAPSRTELGRDRQVRLISEALQGAGGDDLAARVNAALVRRGAPRAFARPELAACLDAEAPDVRPKAGAGTSGPDPTAAGGSPEVDAATSGDPAPDAAPGVAEPAELPDVPSEPERVLPVPAPPAPAPAPKRRLFRRPVA